MGTNNFNICPRCGTANSAVAKYCFQCGSQLKATEQPVVCPKCNTVNAANSTYCKSCGASLTTENNSKVCPRCKSYVHAGATICSKCGYSFGSGYAEPVNNGTGAVLKPPKRIKPVPVGSVKARIGGTIRLVFSLLFLYMLIMPPFMAIPSLDFGTYILTDPGVSTGTAFNGYQIIAKMANGLGNLTANEWIIYIIFAVTVITAVVEFFSGLAHMISGRLLKDKNGFALFMLIVSILTAVYLVLCQSAAAISVDTSGFISNMFHSWSTVSTTYLSANYYLMIAYYFVVLILSLIFKKPKQQVMQIGR